MPNPTHFTGPVIVGSGSYESLTAARTLTAEDSGKTFGLNLAAGFAVTLPTVTLLNAGWGVKFRVEIQPTGNYTVIATDADGDVIAGATATAGDGTACDFASDTLTDVITVALTAAEVGDWFTVETNGTLYFVSGITTLATAITFT